MKNSIGVIPWLFIIGAGVIIYMHQHHKVITVPSNSQICTAAKPCIQLNDGSGHKLAVFNDFRFEADSCLAYRMTIKDSFKQYCGPYDLQWIGPDNTKGITI